MKNKFGYFVSDAKDFETAFEEFKKYMEEQLDCEDEEIVLLDEERDILNAVILLGGYEMYVDDEHDLYVYFDDGRIQIPCTKEAFKWFVEYENYDPEELLHQYA